MFDLERALYIGNLEVRVDKLLLELPHLGGKLLDLVLPLLFHHRLFLLDYIILGFEILDDLSELSGLVLVTQFNDLELSVL